MGKLQYHKIYFHSNIPNNEQVLEKININSSPELQVEVFKTSVQSKLDIDKLSDELNNILKDIKWNFDLEDLDKILRIETLNPMIVKSVKNLLSNKGFECVELND